MRIYIMFTVELTDRNLISENFGISNQSVESEYICKISELENIKFLI